MNIDPLPPDLRELEARLARRPGPDPSPELRARVLGAAVTPPRPNFGWRLASWSAVVVMLLNIGLSIANGARFHRLAEVTNVERPTPPAGMGDPFEDYAANAIASLSPSPSAGSPDRSLFSRTDVPPTRAATLP